jgi:hypothetical protein
MATPKTSEQTVHEEFNRLRGKLAGFIVTTMKSLSYDAEKAVVEALNS